MIRENGAKGCLLAPSLQTLTDIDEIPCQSFLLKTEQAQFPQSFTMREMFQSLHHLCCSPLDPLQKLHVSLVLGSTEPVTIVLYPVAERQCKTRTLIATPQIHLPDAFIIMKLNWGRARKNKTKDDLNLWHGGLGIFLPIRRIYPTF